jgi:hypothetical protein
MLTRLLLAAVFALSLLAPAAIVPPTASAADCQFVLGFKAIHDMIPAIVGDCVVDEHHNPENGDGLQETVGVNGAGGLAVCDSRYTSIGLVHARVARLATSASSPIRQYARNVT